MKKKNIGQSSIFQRSDDKRWVGYIVIAYDERKKKYIRKYASSENKLDVERKIERYRDEYIKKIVFKDDENDYSLVEGGKMSVQKWARIWLKNYCNHIKPSTYYTYKQTEKTYIRQRLGNYCLRDVTVHDVQLFINTIMKEKNLKPKTIKNILGVVSKMFDCAVEIALIDVNPCRSVRIPKVPKYEIRVFTDLELEILFDELKPSPYYNFFKILVLTGLRISECIGLTWDCVRESAGVLRVYRQVQRNYNDLTYEFVTPKNGKPRNVVMPQTVIDIFNKVKEKQIAAGTYNKKGFIFQSLDDPKIPCRYRDLYYVFKAAIEETGLDDGSPHDLRHTYAVNAIRAGDNIKSVQTNLGHSTPAFTLDRYAIVTSDMILSSQKKLQTFIDTLNI